MKSSRSIQTSRVMGRRRVPSSGFSGLFSTSAISSEPSGRVVMVTLRGLSTAMRRGALAFRSSLTLYSSRATSVKPLNLVMPMVWQKLRMAAGV